MGTVIELSEFEQQLAELIARGRYRYARANNLPDLQHGDQCKHEIDRNGAGAELAFCRIYNLYPDLSPGPAKADAFTKLGKSVDVKCTTYQNGRLLALTSKSTSPCDIYVLMICRWPRYRCVGYATSGQLLDSRTVMDLGHGPTHALSQADLTAIEEGGCELS